MYYTLTRYISLLGFDAYLGFIHTENYQLNPIVNTFVALLRLKVPKSTKASVSVQKDGTAEDTIEIGGNLELGKIIIVVVN